MARTAAPEIARCVFTLCACVACGSPDRPALAPRISSTEWNGNSAVGCWNTVDAPEDFFLRVPKGATFALTDSPDLVQRDSLRPTKFTVQVLPGPDTARARRWSAWGADSVLKDRIHAWIGDGFTGVELELQVRTNTLIGTARWYSDSWPLNGLWSFYRATRVTCPQ